MTVLNTAADYQRLIKALRRFALPVTTGGEATGNYHRALIVLLELGDGHLGAAIETTDAGNRCLKIAQQMQAVEKSITNAKRSLVHDHMDHCLDLGNPEAYRAEL